EAFATLGSELDKVSAAQLERGYRLTELLKQGLNSPMPVEEQVVIVFAGTTGILDHIPVSDVKRLETDLLDIFRGRYATLLDEIRSTGALPAGVKDAVDVFKAEFVPTETAAAAETVEA
ncbi:MAG TPA: F0F1 ATP synthase subunit alpha, partial [Acidimicrobiales bacterium]